MKFEFLESAEVSDVGKKRKKNEDACLRLPDLGVFCVADGMGGAAGGKLASEAIKSSLQEIFAQASPAELGTFSGHLNLFKNGTSQACKWIKDFADEKVIGPMGSTVVALVCDPENSRRAMALHAGDSRLYRYRNKELKLLTMDHSAVAALAAKLGCEPDSLPARYQNELVRAVGLKESVELEETPLEVRSGDVFLLCSDGLTKMLMDEEIALVLMNGADNSPVTVAQALVDRANAAGGRDNITVIYLKAGNIDDQPAWTEPRRGTDADKTATAPAGPVVEAQISAIIANELAEASDTEVTPQGDTPQTNEPASDGPAIYKVTPSDDLAEGE